MFEVEKLESIDVIVPNNTGAIVDLLSKLNDYRNLIIDLREGVLLSDADLEALESLLIIHKRLKSLLQYATF